MATAPVRTRGVRISVTSQGLREARQDLAGKQKRVKDLSRALNNAAKDLVTLMSDTFKYQRDPAGVPWAELAESTVRQKLGRRYIGGRAGLKRGTPGQRAAITRRTRFDKYGRYKKRFAEKAYKAVFGKGMKILVDTGQLSGSLFARVLGKNTIEFGANKSYITYHQTGTKKLPRRMVAPVEYYGGRWHEIRTGPAKAFFDALEQRIGMHVEVG